MVRLQAAWDIRGAAAGYRVARATQAYACQFYRKLYRDTCLRPYQRLRSRVPGKHKQWISKTQEECGTASPRICVPRALHIRPCLALGLALPRGQATLGSERSVR